MNKSPLDLPMTSDKKTVELCGDEPHKGMRCIRPRGHVGDHECHMPTEVGAVTWTQRAS